MSWRTSVAVARSGGASCRSIMPCTFTATTATIPKKCVMPWTIVGAEPVVAAEPVLRNGVIEFASASAESPLESISRVAIFEAGLPAPELQHEWSLRDGTRAFSDFYWPGFRIIGEADGDAKYSLGEGDASETVLASMKREKSRDQELRLLGASVIHWGWEEAWDGARLISLLTRAGLHR